MKILGIVMTAGSTAAVMIDGRVVACISEERFSRSKNDERYPKQAIEAVLRQAGIAPSELDVVAFSGERFDAKATLYRKYSTWSVLDRLREQREYWYPRMYERKDPSFPDLFKDKLDTAQYPGAWEEVLTYLRNGRATEQDNAFFQAFRRQVVSRHLGVEPGQVLFVHHHRAHGYYAYYASPIRGDPTLILTGDAWGDDMNASVSVAERERIRVLSRSTNFNLARLYRSMTLLLGMKPDEHEYKVMGLAAYAKPDQIQGPLAVFRETLRVDGLGFGYHAVPPDLYVYFQRRFEGRRFDAIAGALQRYTEEILIQWVRNSLAATGARRLVFGGGIAMNVKAMMEIAKLPELDELFVCPSPSDESLAIGACHVVMHDWCLAHGQDPRAILRPLAHAYLGPDLDRHEFDEALRRVAGTGRYAVRQGVDLSAIAQRLATGAIIGRCVGRSEFGARALGNRSILADPRNPGVIRRLNDAVKGRDFWMPFAPSILEERAADYLINSKRLSAPYMTIAFETTPLAHGELRATLHPADLTCRPQLVSRAVNPEYHALLRAFEQVTGVGGLLNTSFNIHGEPIIQTAADAVNVLERSGLDGLVLGDYVLEKVVPSGAVEGGRSAGLAPTLEHQ